MWLFEDSEKSPMSLLLKEMLGESVDFSRGNKALDAKIGLYKDLEGFICFVDYVLDNPDTVTAYDRLRVKYPEVNFVRIPCIEYFAFILLKHCCPYNVSKVSKEDTMWYTLNGSCSNWKLYTQESFEKYVKSLTEIEPKCLYTSSSKNGRGKFYYKSCHCGGPACSVVTEEISLQCKGSLVLSWFPCNSPGIWEEINRRIREVCLAKLRELEENKC